MFQSTGCFKKIGLTPLWSKYQGNDLNKAALITWAIGVVFAVICERLGILHLFFLFVPTYLLSMAVYIGLAKSMGAAEDYSKQEAQYYDELKQEDKRHAIEAKQEEQQEDSIKQASTLEKSNRDNSTNFLGCNIHLGS